MFFLAGISITFFLVIILLTKKGKSSADYVLAIWLALIGIHLWLYYGFISGTIYNYPYLLGVVIPMPLLHGPMLYLYILTVTSQNGFNQKNLLHLIPPAIVYLSMARFFLMSNDEKIQVYKNEGAGFETQSFITLIAIIISGFVYVFLSFRHLQKYKKRINEQFSNTEKIDLNWLRYLILGILCIWLIILLNGRDLLIFGSVVFFVLFLGYFGIRQVGIFTAGYLPGNTLLLPARGQETIESPAASPPAAEPSAKYGKSALPKEVADKIYQDLTRLMLIEKLFKDEDISLAELARQLSTHPNNLSQVINTYEGKSFYDYINGLRVEEFKALSLLPANKNYTLLALAHQCGFNSKTSFNRNFKKISGQSPSAFLRELNLQLAED